MSTPVDVSSWRLKERCPGDFFEGLHSILVPQLAYEVATKHFAADVEGNTGVVVSPSDERSSGSRAPGWCSSSSTSSCSRTRSSSRAALLLDAGKHRRQALSEASDTQFWGHRCVYAGDVRLQLLHDGLAAGIQPTKNHHGL